MRMLGYENAFLLGVCIGIVLEHFIDKQADRKEMQLKLREKILEFKEKELDD